MFNDICLLTEGQRPEYLRVSNLPKTFGLELIESVLTNHAAIFPTHREQADILRTRVMPFIISALRGKTNFATSVRLMRILYTLLRRHLAILPSESMKMRRSKACSPKMPLNTSIQSARQYREANRHWLGASVYDPRG